MSEEITARRYHLIGVGMTDAIPHGVPLADAIARVHVQRGVAIVAHPYDMSWIADVAAFWRCWPRCFCSIQSLVAIADPPGARPRR